MITETRITEDLKPAGLDWITALRAPAIRGLMDEGALQMSLFDDRDRAAVASPAFPGERLIVCRKAEAIAQEARLDGFYVIRTSVPEDTLDDTGTVRAYKGLAQVERAFRALKGLDLQVRPIYHTGWHWLETRGRAHVFLCMLAYSVEWHMRQRLAAMQPRPPPHASNRWPRRPARSWIYCQATRPDRLPRVVAH